jgi:hypothetical protein
MLSAFGFAQDRLRETSLASIVVHHGGNSLRFFSRDCWIRMSKALYNFVRF